jgi:alcohol dehydrogenase
MEEKKVDPGVASRHYNAAASMKALVFHGVGKMPTLEEVPRPSLKNPTDIIIRVHKTTICGTDLNILGGNVPTTDVGRVLGHEGIGHVVAAGDAVEKWSVGDRVLTSCITGESQIACAQSCRKPFGP